MDPAEYDEISQEIDREPISPPKVILDHLLYAHIIFMAIIFDN